MVSHWDEDHTWGFIQMLEETDVHISRLYCYPPEEAALYNASGADTGRKLIGKVNAQGGQVVRISPDQLTQISVGGLKMIVWRTGAPEGGDTRNTNNASIQVYFPDLYYLTTGDMISQLPQFLGQLRGMTIKCYKAAHLMMG